MFLRDLCIKVLDIITSFLIQKVKPSRLFRPALTLIISPIIWKLNIKTLLLDVFMKPITLFYFGVWVNNSDKLSSIRSKFLKHLGSIRELLFIPGKVLLRICVLYV